MHAFVIMKKKITQRVFIKEIWNYIINIKMKSVSIYSKLYETHSIAVDLSIFDIQYVYKYLF